MINSGDPRQFADAAGCADNLIQGHGPYVATGNSRLQAAMLPPATADSAAIKHLARMEKRGDPLVGQRLREARVNLGLTQERLAEQSGIGRSTIGCIETAQRPVGRRTLMDLAEFFNVPLDYFTNRDDLMASAMWVLGRLPPDELEAWVKLMMARATRNPLPPRD